MGWGVSMFDNLFILCCAAEIPGAGSASTLGGRKAVIGTKKGRAGGLLHVDGIVPAMRREIAAGPENHSSVMSNIYSSKDSTFTERKTS
jgi:hypothetical protein